MRVYVELHLHFGLEAARCYRAIHSRRQRSTILQSLRHIKQCVSDNLTILYGDVLAWWSQSRMTIIKLVMARGIASFLCSKQEGAMRVRLLVQIPD